MDEALGFVLLMIVTFVLFFLFSTLIFTPNSKLAKKIKGKNVVQQQEEFVIDSLQTGSIYICK